ncbi:MAG: nuclear transport factor 2 family protein [Vibrio sp.]
MNASDYIELIQEFLTYSMKPDPEKAATYMASDVEIIFTGKRCMAHAGEITAFNASRYKWVKKDLGQFDCVVNDDHAIVYSNGTLYGEWLDGRPFSGNRFIDRFEIRNGKITKMEVWNDSAEWILAPELNQSTEA